MLIWIIYILSEAYVQYRYIKAGNKPFYLILFIIRGMASIFHGILLNVQYGTYQYPILLGFQICSFWIVFDIFLNSLRKESFLYKGKTSGWLDKLPYSIYIPLKVVVLIAAIYFYHLGLQY
jgi:hypothetical protein